MEQWAGEGRIVLTDAAQAHIHQYDVMHTNRFILVDRQGQVRAYIDGVYDWNLDEVMDDIQHLVSLADEGGPALRRVTVIAN
jgi:cytochrome oxidase Cu insertion factor (SCO1/SenC/PrrC family)